jgi:hypothetical protein
LNTSFFDYKVFLPGTGAEVQQKLRGQQAKGLLLLFTTHPEEAELLDFLKKIFSAVQYDLEQDAAYLSVNVTQSVNVASLAKINASKTVICFGFALPQLGFHFEIPSYYPFQHQGITYLFVDDLLNIYQERQAGGKKLSGALWKCLQEIFK